jgi:hypothetical protein
VPKKVLKRIVLAIAIVLAILLALSFFLPPCSTQGGISFYFETAFIFFSISSASPGLYDLPGQCVSPSPLYRGTTCTWG